jgi:pantoate--beta-alanine ligase
MKVICTVDELGVLLDELSKNNTIGFSPTMGALHNGHLSLIKSSEDKCDISVCSIFVNPTQFDRSEDLKKYPRTLENDLSILEKAGCDIVFTPSVNEIYPETKEARPIDLNGLDSRMEGANRPGHFDGVVQVVKRLLDIVNPDFLFMGQKDFQQFTIINYMLRYYDLATKLIVCPIVREEDGLAMSSRNMRLDGGIRLRASNIYKTLLEAKDWLKFIPVEYVKEKAMNALSINDFRPEYFEVVSGSTLLPIKDYRKEEYVVACTAVWAGDVRLIDNMIYKGSI